MKDSCAYFVMGIFMMTCSSTWALEVKGMQVDISIKLQAPTGCAEIKSWHGDFSDMDGTKRDQMHRGLDIVAPLGTPVISAAPGKVIYKDKQAAGGNSLMIWHGQDVHGNHVISYYAHLGEFKIEKDAIIKRGDTVGTLGASGNNMPRSGTPHLHFEVLIYPDAEFKFWFTGFLRGFTTVSPNYFSYPITKGTESSVTVPRNYPIWNAAFDYGDANWNKDSNFTGFSFPLICKGAEK